MGGVSEPIGPPTAHVIFCLDDSGSMARTAKQTQTAYNHFVQTLKDVKGAEIRFSLVKFGNGRTYLKAVPIYQVEEMKNYNPNDGTAIWEAMLHAISLGKEVNFGNRTVVCLQTDGGDEQRDSMLRAAEQIASLRKTGWEFNLMGAGNIAREYRVGQRLGIPEANQIYYGSNEKETLLAFGRTGTSIAGYATGRTNTASYK